MSDPIPTLRTFLDMLAAQNELRRVAQPVSARLEAAALIATLDEHPVLLEEVAGSAYRVTAGIVSRRSYLASAIGMPPDELLHRLVDALAAPVSPPFVVEAPWQEVAEPTVDLRRLPVLTYWENDAGPYVTAGVLFLADPQTGPNASFHRLLQLDERHFVARLVEQRTTHTAWRHAAPDDLPVAVAIGLPPHILLAASMGPPPGVDEMSLAQALAPTPMVRCRNGVAVPWAAEIILEGRLQQRLALEGPFVDLTGTLDVVRQQPILVIDRVYHRRRPIYQALLPGGWEHQLLMGLPKEPTICAAVATVADCRHVYITPGGASWLHAVVQIHKTDADAGVRAGEAAFRGHPSLKHVVVVDDDVDLFNADMVEWAIATRFQADRDLQVWPDRPSSSLDPSAQHVPGKKARGAKMALDATVPWKGNKPPAMRPFRRLSFPKAELSSYKVERVAAADLEDNPGKRGQDRD